MVINVVSETEKEKKKKKNRDKKLICTPQTDKQLHLYYNQIIKYNNIAVYNIYSRLKLILWHMK